MSVLDRIESGATPDRAELTELLSLREPAALKRLYAAAYRIKSDRLGRSVFFRGLVEVSNVCVKNCFYCGIRRDNSEVRRYTMSEDEVVEDVFFAWRSGFGSAVLQAGERQDPGFIEMIGRVLRRVKGETGPAFGITLSLGEQTEETYRFWRACGADRYLLRIEEADKSFYAALHPADHSWETRRNCLLLLQKCGYQTGTGVMSGLPGQTPEHLANDLLFMKELSIDMIGMGPYVPHPRTPLAARFPAFEEHRAEQLETALKMIACARILMPDVNIASTTALQVLAPDGRERGLLAGANVIMPNVGAAFRKKNYQLYTGKTGLDDSPEEALSSLKGKIESLGETLILNRRGDPEHYFIRTGQTKEY